VIVGNLHQTDSYGSVGGISAFAIGTVSCNIGTCWLNWFSSPSNQHPVIGQNMFRLADGRFEHLGQSWLKHGFTALDQNFCSNNCIDTTGTHLGVLCSDPYSSFLNGQQSNLGPKFEVNASTGFHPHPVTNGSTTGNAIFKRVQVKNTDLDPALNPGALYFIEGQYIAEDDAAADNQNNNASYRKVFVNGADYDTGVDEVDIQVPNDGLFILGAKVTDLGNGMWHYEYAVQNLNSHRSAGSFSVPFPTGAALDSVGFHDVDYHSGEPFDGADWTHNGGAGGELVWSTTPYSQNQDANALRWGTLYNFRFDAAVEPTLGDVTLGLFRPGVPIDITAETMVPTLCNIDGTCDFTENQCVCAADCGEPPITETACNDGSDDDCDLSIDCGDTDCCGDGFCAPDDDADSHHGCLDCNDAANTAWDTPGEATGLLLAKDGADTVFTGEAPTYLGGSVVTYEMLRSGDPKDFGMATCLVGGDPSATTLSDADVPVTMFAYLPRALNDCPANLGWGDLGSDTSGVPRKGRCI
jgi:hypothetical protein